jgi:citrate lyase subunit beta / citryl-CoA lyase
MNLRSLLFAPGNRPDLIAKLPRSNPDGVVIDLEDAVATHQKEEARVIAKKSMQNLLATSPTCKVFLRTNAVNTSWFEKDLDALSQGITGLVLPKVESATHLEQAHQSLKSIGWENLPIIAGIETARGVACVGEINHASLIALYFGAEDFITDMGGLRNADNFEVLYARSQVVLQARICGLHALDIIDADFRNQEAFRKSALQGRALGYAGKMCIHPGQVPIANEIFSASSQEIERARALLHAYNEALGKHSGVFEFEGQMIDEPMLKRARMILGEA